MDKYEVTNALYKKCVKKGPCSPPPENRSNLRINYYDNPEYDDYPVIYVNWFQAQIYCSWRGARLPTEAEWEYAARGTGSRTYPWGETIDTGRANYAAGDTVKVGSYPGGVSPFGIYDMAGNVYEWVADSYQERYYSTLDENVLNPLGPPAGQHRVIRGGGWNSGDATARSAYRLQNDPNERYAYLGFRCALTP